MEDEDLAKKNEVMRAHHLNPNQMKSI